MIKKQTPTVTQANIVFFTTAVATLLGSAFFQPKLGLGTNLWINEFIYILLPPVLLARFYGWSFEDVYRYRKTSGKNHLISILSGISMWFFVFYVSKITRLFLDRYIGLMPTGEQTSSSVYQSFLLVIGMIILAPICEETFFRGFVQKAYEGHNRKKGFIMAGVIFGSYHILNGVSEVIPACILGMGMGYLVYKTNAISTSMLFHAAVNICAVFLGGIMEMSSTGTIPVWHHVIAFTGLITSFLLLKSVKDDEHGSQIHNEDNKEKRIPVTGIVFLTLAALFLIGMGAMEIISRANGSF